MIKVYDNAAPAALCEQVMSLFEISDHRYVGKPGSGISDKKNVTELYIDPHLDTFSAIDQQLFAIFSDYAQQYFSHFDWFNPRYRDVGYFVKKYAKGQGHFDTHVDVSVAKNAKRMLVMILYLNDVLEGGETEFVHTGHQVKPRQGRLLLFPPMWMYPHKSKLTLSGDKYTLNTFLEFLP